MCDNVVALKVSLSAFSSEIAHMSHPMFCEIYCAPGDLTAVQDGMRAKLSDFMATVLEDNFVVWN
jgi:hypothetical protein